MMIDIEGFCRQLGAAKGLDQDEYLALDIGLRLLCTEQGWTLIFDQLSVSDDSMLKAFEVSRELGFLIPMTVRSGHLAVRYLAAAQIDDTADALQKLRKVIATLEERPATIAE